MFSHKDTMSSTYLPVETILKVDDNEILIAENPKDEKSPSGNYVSIGTQCDWKVEITDPKSYNMLSSVENDSKINLFSTESLSVPERSTNEVPLVIRNWPPHSDPNACGEQKLIVPAALSQQFSCNIQALPVDEKFFLQFDYKTRNKLKTKQRRLDPYYRTQERVRQRTVMRIKRQDPRFRAAEREKGRYRMRLKRLDPVFRSQERERQRERMKIKRSNPVFREKEREQQKSRLHVKRLNPEFKEKERAQDRLRMRLKRQHNGLFSTVHTEKVKLLEESESDGMSESQTCKDISDTCETQTLRSNQSVFPENFNARFLCLKPKENLESFHFKKQHILNFNFYNSSKEQWAVPDDLCAKNITPFNIIGECEKLQESINSSHIALFDKANSIGCKKSHIKTDVELDNPIDAKHEKPSNVHSEKQEDPSCMNDSPISRFPLPSSQVAE
ncbi:putative uncharacterized protein DDB_G0271982 [Uloborus diversus]|uniref:putative uncharacterized protein DDB_G0271982 n=1 Tax=Uloborus diversus TaxID=327109 RepID=UPI002409B1C8|nr:putative uncharacterized protein DDB_G0271982 [Uloborus diversus]